MSKQDSAFKTSGLSAAKKKLLEQRLKAMKARGSKPAIPLRPKEGPAPLSFAQQRLWFFYQWEPENPVYNLPTAVRLKGLLDEEALKKSIQWVVERHETLRTTFSMQKGEPVQMVHPADDFPLPVMDLTVFTPAQREERMRELAEAEAKKPFHLETGPVIRAQLIRMDSDDHVLLLNMHHIVSDGWSMGVFVREVSEAYSALSKGLDAPSEQLPIQYVDFTYWQKDTFQGERMEKQLNFWKERLSGVPVLQIPTDRPRPARQTFNGMRYHFTIKKALLDEMRAFCQREGVTLFMALLAGYKVLLHRYTGQTDFAVGSPIANRNRPELEKLIGFFVNTLVLRDSFEPDISFRQFLQMVKQTCMEAYAHPDVPFEKLVVELNEERDLSYPPLFQTLFVLQNAPQAKEAAPGLKMEWMALDTGASMFDITVSMEESEEGLTGFFEYNTDLFDSATIERMAQHLENLIESALRQPDQAIAKLPFLTEIEKQLFFEWNQTKKEVELAPFHHLFAQKAAQLPDQVALDFKGRTLTYRELDERANQLAHYLIESGVGKGTFVAISMERSLEMIIAALGVMKSGGAYIPLDPTYPSDRLGYMLEDSKAPVLLTQRHLAKKIPSGGARMICIDEEWEAICQRSKEDPAVPVTAEDLAYMIYTSGSTGQPKGVLVTHRGIGNVMREQRHLFGADETSRVLQFASFSFDASVFDFCMAFGAGATLYLAEKDDLLPGPGLIRFLRDNRISHATLSPSVLNAMPDADLPDLQVIVTAGEACSAEIVNRWAPGRRFFNAYGPTEATIWASTKQCRPGEGKPTIGFAVANVELHVLDQYRQPVPLGVPGELYIGGVGLARGYHGRPDLTEERFIPHPEKRGERLYKTGDLVRFLPNGDIDFLGRVDDQVKIRGFRIELGEIENLLAQHPDVKTCAVIAREDRPGVKRLVAYVVAQEPGKEITAELRAELKQKVPDFMVPAFFIQLEKMPMTANGKIDRKALPVPDESQLERVEVTEARNDTEAKLSEIWSDVLGVTPIGIHDNFFDLGGDSILGIQVVTRAKEAGIAITTKQLFEHQTIAELAKEAGSAETVVAEQGRVTGEALLTPIQRWFFEQELEDPHHWNQSVILKVNRPLQERHLAGAIQAVLNHHDALRFRYEKKEEGWKQIHADEVPIPLVRVDMPESEDSVEAIREQVERHQSQFDLGQAPLIRFIWLQFGEGRPSRLAIIAHHLVIDGVSWRILMEDLIRAYTALENGQPVQLPPKTTSYKQWGELLSRAAGTDAFKDEAEFWMGQVGQPVELLPREIDGDNRVASSRTITRILSEDETSALLHEVPAAYRTQMNDMLLSALALTLAEWTERDRFLIDLESHGRQDVVDGADLTRTIGWFTAKYPIVLKKDQESLGHLIKSVKEQLRAIPNQGFGYGVLKHLRKDELSNRLGDLPNAEIAFNYLGQFDSHASGTHWFEQTDEPAGQTRSGRGRRTHLLEIDSMVTGGRLRIDWTYSDDIHHRETMEKLSERYVYWLKELIAHCLSDKAGGFTPSDFKEFGWSQTDLDQITAALVRTLGGKPHDPETD